MDLEVLEKILVRLLSQAVVVVQLVVQVNQVAVVVQRFLPLQHHP